MINVVTVGDNSRVELFVNYLLPTVQAADFDRVISYEELIRKFSIPLVSVQRTMRSAIKRIERTHKYTFICEKKASGYRLANVEDIIGRCDSVRRSLYRRARRGCRVAVCASKQAQTAEQRARVTAQHCHFGAIALAASVSKLSAIEKKTTNQAIPNVRFLIESKTG